MKSARSACVFPSVMSAYSSCELLYYTAYCYAEDTTMTLPARKPTRALFEMTATEIAASVSSGATTREAVARACLERIEAREPQVLAWQYLNPDQVIAQAR